ncbi:MAG: FecR family protein [Chitinophagaceae bacterium]|nr:FecR family protein [Chitinophagaceae bacterium]
MDRDNDIAVLFERFAIGEADKEEFIAFYEKVKEAGDETLLSLMDAHFEKNRISKNAAAIDWDGMLKKIFAESNGAIIRNGNFSEKETGIVQNDNLTEKETGIIRNGNFSAKETGVIRKGNFLKSKILKWLSAAAVLLLIGVGTYVYINNSKTETQVATTVQPPAASDIAPGSNKATLTLSDGKIIELNNATSETIKDGALSIGNNNGQLVYSAELPIPSHGGVAPGGAGVGSVQRLSTNTMSTPKGGQYQLTLSDGTRVWLNAASSITYPTSFTEKTREVSITGEAYFEVTQNSRLPFVVKTSKELITVLGTSFNVNTYPDEPSSKTSLIEGSIKINNLILKPNQAYTNGKIISTSISQDLAWKNGVFDFNNITVQQAMRQIARWYDVNIIYDKPVNEVFIGEVNRNLTLSQVLKVLDGLGVHFRLEGKNLHVFP